MVSYSAFWLILYINSLSLWVDQWLGVLLAFFTTESARPDGRTDGQTGFLQERAKVEASPSSGCMHLSVRLSVCDRQSATISLWSSICDRQCMTVNLWPSVVRAKYRSRLSVTASHESQISRSWNSSLESQMQQHGSNRRRKSRFLIWLAWLLKLEMMVDVDTATQGFLGRNQKGNYRQNSST
jgi:hypothetical protein